MTWDTGSNAGLREHRAEGQAVLTVPVGHAGQGVACVGLVDEWHKLKGLKSSLSVWKWLVFQQFCNSCSAFMPLSLCHSSGRPTRASRCRQRAEDRHTAVDVAGAGWPSCIARGGGQDRSTKGSAVRTGGYVL